MAFVHDFFIVGFEATGCQYDPNGNLIDWLDEQTGEILPKKT